MKTLEKRKAIAKYFAEKPTWPLLLVALGIISYIIGIILLAEKIIGAGLALPLVGIVFTGLGIYGIMKEPKITDRQMDDWIREDIDDLTTRAMDKVDIATSDLVGEPLRVYAPRLYDQREHGLLSKQGKDGGMRFSLYDVTIIYFTNRMLLCYNCGVDIIRGDAFGEITEEYFYQDVVSVSTSKENTSYAVELRTSGGTSRMIYVPSIEEGEEVMKVIRKVLREKKS